MTENTAGIAAKTIALAELCDEKFEAGLDIISIKADSDSDPTAPEGSGKALENAVKDGGAGDYAWSDSAGDYVNLGTMKGVVAKSLDTNAVNNVVDTMGTINKSSMENQAKLKNMMKSVG